MWDFLKKPPEWAPEGLRFIGGAWCAAERARGVRATKKGKARP